MRCGNVLRRDLPAAEARVAAEMAEARAADIHALPTLFVGTERIEGASASADELTALIDRQGGIPPSGRAKPGHSPSPGAPVR